MEFWSVSPKSSVFLKGVVVDTEDALEALTEVLHSCLQLFDTLFWKFLLPEHLAGLGGETAQDVPPTIWTVPPTSIFESEFCVGVRLTYVTSLDEYGFL